MTKPVWNVKRPLVFITLFFTAGLILGKEIPGWNGLSFWPAAGFGLGYWSWRLWRRRVASLVPAGLVFLLIGLAISANYYRPPALPFNAVRFTEQQGLVLGGRVVEQPRISNGRARLTIRLGERLLLDGRRLPASGKIQLTVQTPDLSVGLGDYVRFPAALKSILGFGIPGCFDYEARMAGRRIYTGAYLGAPGMLRVLQESPSPHSPSKFISSVRNSAGCFLDQHLDEPLAGLCRAMLLGQAGRTKPYLVTAFRNLGVSHLLAVSGLHVGLIALAGFWLIICFLKIYPELLLKIDAGRLTAGLTFIPVLFYAALAGGKPSTFRAATMITVFLGAMLVGRRRDPLSALAAAALIILALDPDSLYTAAFQLSFIAAGTLIIFLPGLLNKNRKSLRNHNAAGLIRRRILAAFMITLCAGLGTMPVVAYHFYSLPLWSIPANMILTPIIALGITPIGLAGLGMATVFPGISSMLFSALNAVFNPLLGELAAVGASPGLTWLTPRPGLLFFIVFYGTGAVLVLVRVWISKPRPSYLPKTAFLKFFALFNDKTLIVKTMAAGIAILALTALPFLYSHPSGPTRLEVNILDVGQGSAAYAAFPDGRGMIIDGGGFPGSEFDPGESLIAPFLLNRGVTRVDVLALSHPQEDHVGGLVYLADNFKPQEIWTNGSTGLCRSYFDFIDAARRHNIRRPDLRELNAPKGWGGAEIRVLSPHPGFLEKRPRGDRLRELNNDSLVIKIEYGDHSFLFPGDIEAAGETRLIKEKGDELQADVLIAPHHGSDTSLTAGFLEAVRPDIVVFSSGRYNRFGFPSAESLRAVLSMGARIYRTDIHGTISFITDGETMDIKTYRRP